MVTRTFADLVRDLRLRRTVGDKPPVLLLGAGASVDAGIGAMGDLFAFFGLADFDAFTTYIATTTAAERYRYLADFLQTRKPAEVTPGYRALAALCAQNYFDVVLTTNMDPLLDDALAAAQLWRRDYLLIVNGVIRPERLDLLLAGQSPRVKIVKLHGDLFQRFMAWTVEEMDTFLAEILPRLTPAVAGRDVLVVGHSLRDARIRDLAQTTGGALWFTHPQRVPDHLAANATMRTVVAPEAAFEAFFPALAAALQIDVPAPFTPPVSLPARPRAAKGPAPKRPRPAYGRGAAPTAPRPPSGTVKTLDDVLASVLTIEHPGGAATATAFVLESPRVIVCDAYVVTRLIDKQGQLAMVTADGRRFRARVVRTSTAHPFGPALVEVPESIKIPGLTLDSRPVGFEDAVQVAVAAGSRTGISTGAVATMVEVSAKIEPLGRVDDLVELGVFVRPGSSGAPVVDGAMAVRGFIVAGSEDERNPRSYMYPSAAWAGDLDAQEPAPRRRRPRPRR